MGIYDSGLSCWERNQRGLPPDHAGEGSIDEINELISKIESDVVPEEEEQPEVDKPKAKANPKKKS